MPSDDNIVAAVEAGLRNRRQQGDQEERDALFQLVRGQLRIGMSSLPLDATAQTIIDWFIDGRRDVPASPYRPEFRALVGSACGVLGFTPPPPAATEVLVNVAIGWMADRMPTLPMARPVVMQKFTGLYLAGG